jgi:hypothetical protein
MQYKADKEAAQHEEALEAERSAHHARQKMNARALREYGDGTEPFKCNPRTVPPCPICFPPAPKEEPKGSLDIRDMRHISKHGTPGKRGTCKVCGEKCSSRRWIYCSVEHRKEGRRLAKLRFCVCGTPLPEGSRLDRKWCSEPCRKRHQRKQARIRT